MANVKISFEGYDTGYSSLLECEKRVNSIFIKITDRHTDDVQYILLDKSTAIKFSKVLRTEISKIQD